MPKIANNGDASYEVDLQGLYETLQGHRGDLLKMARELQLAVRVAGLAEARQRAAGGAPGDPRVERLRVSGDAILRRVAALDAEMLAVAQRAPLASRAQTSQQGARTD